jgi:hypothetical protein
MEFFRDCPECGRRFHIKLENRKLVSEHREKIPGRKVVRTVVIRSASGRSGMAIGPPSVAPIAVQEGKPIVIDIEEFQYAYRCHHCRHEWSETHIESRREG